MKLDFDDGYAIISAFMHWLTTENLPKLYNEKEIAIAGYLFTMFMHSQEAEQDES